MVRNYFILVLQLLLLSLFGCAQKAEQSQDREIAIENLESQNRLQHSKSPYLLMHADNPVDWYPWGEEAFKRAEQENKPIFLSIGYSTCNWCYVMERKVFMNEEIAGKRNKYFVNIKVDREERPDVDWVYMNAVRIMTGGGWPMSVFITPAFKPFFGATYIPPESSQGRPGFSQLADRLHEAWQNQHEQAVQQAEKITERVREVTSTDLEPQKINSSALQKAFSSYAGRYDSKYGGFGSPPKFPRPFLDDKIVLSWNGLLISAYANAYRILGDERYKKQAIRSVEFLMDKLYDPESSSCAATGTEKLNLKLI